MSDLNQNATSETANPTSLDEAITTTETTASEPIENAQTQVIEELRTAVTQAEAREKDLQDKHLRLHAEFDNYRRRTAREHMELIETANGKLLSSLSEVLDNFERAFAEENKTSNPEAFAKGMQLIHDQFRKVLFDAGLEILNPAGEEFDPNSQEAFMKQPSETIAENFIVTVFQKGYKIKNKILKTAKVIVSAGKI